MILHLGGDYFVKTKDILMILDYKEAVENKDTGLFLEGIEQVVLDEGVPKAVVVTKEFGREKAYLSPISAQTLYKRGAGSRFPCADAGHPVKRKETNERKPSERTV